MSRVTISMKAARALESFVGTRAHLAFEPADVAEALTELRRAMEPEPKRKPRKPSAPERAAKYALVFSKALRQTAKAQKRDRRASIREALVKRADGTCECGCGLNVLGMIVQSIPQVDHMFGRGRGRLPESEETCWLLRADCHRDKTNNHPDAATWWRKFIAHCARQGVRAIGSEAGPMRWTEVSLAAKRRLAFVETRSMLGAGLKERHRAKAEEKIQELEAKVHKAVFGEENQR